MEGFTLVLLIAWLLLLGSFVSMFFMDRATQQARNTASSSPGTGPKIAGPKTPGKSGGK